LQNQKILIKNRMMFILTTKQAVRNKSSFKKEMQSKNLNPKYKNFKLSN